MTSPHDTAQPATGPGRQGDRLTGRRAGRRTLLAALLVAGILSAGAALAQMAGGGEGSGSSPGGGGAHGGAGQPAQPSSFEFTVTNHTGRDVNDLVLIFDTPVTVANLGTAENPFPRNEGDVATSSSLGWLVHLVGQPGRPVTIGAGKSVTVRVYYKDLGNQGRTGPERIRIVRAWWTDKNGRKVPTPGPCGSCHLPPKNHPDNPPGNPWAPCTDCHMHRMGPKHPALDTRTMVREAVGESFFDVWAPVGAGGPAPLPTAQHTRTFVFPNDTGRDVNNLHVYLNRPVRVETSEPFKDYGGTNVIDFANGTVKKGGKATIKVTGDGPIKVIEWWWTVHKPGDAGDPSKWQRAGKVHRGDPPPPK